MRPWAAQTYPKFMELHPPPSPLPPPQRWAIQLQGNEVTKLEILTLFLRYYLR